MQPLSPDRSFASMDDHVACRTMLSHGSKTFMLASQLLPWRVRDPSIGLYAFCRQADDAVDLHDDGIAALDELNRRLDALYDGAPVDGPADRAFADTVAQFHIPKVIPQALLEGFAWDIEGRYYDDIVDLEAYAARVAGTVGAMMALIMGVTDRKMLARACDLGVAMQLTNIARDVGEDARMGRIYLPLRWLEEAGVDRHAFLAAPAYSDQLGSVIARLLARAEEFYHSADVGLAGLPASCRPALRAARLLYAEIGRAVERNALDSVSQRAYAPLGRKIALAARATFAPPLADGLEPPLLHEPAFMVEAARTLQHNAPQRSPWSLADRLVWSAHLLHRPGQPKRTRRVGRGAALQRGNAY